jgi:hypothetical protein
VQRSAETPAAPIAEPAAYYAPRGLRRAVIHAFVLFHLAAVTAWSFTSTESKAPVDRAVRSAFGWYMFPTGLWQAWNMFAPNPGMSNVYVEAEVTLRDGSTATWRFPRMDELGYFERYRVERYRKWGNERVFAGGKPDPVIAADAARFAARQVERPGNPATRVELARYRAQIPSPRRGGLAPHDQPVLEWDRKVFFTLEPGGRP